MKHTINNSRKHRLTSNKHELYALLKNCLKNFVEERKKWVYFTNGKKTTATTIPSIINALFFRCYLNVKIEKQKRKNTQRLFGNNFPTKMKRNKWKDHLFHFPIIFFAFLSLSSNKFCIDVETHQSCYSYSPHFGRDLQIKLTFRMMFKVDTRKVKASTSVLKE